MATLLTLPRFKALARARKAVPRDVLVRKELLSSAELLEDRTLRFTISTAVVDRAGDTVAVEGWDLTAYRQNPVVLWGHDSYEFPIGRAVEIGQVGDALKATVEFVPADVPCAGERAEAVLQLFRKGFLSATSVGFRPLEWDITEDPERGDDWLPGFDFRTQELLEFSCVTIPCNPQALIDPGQQGVDPADGTPTESVSPGGAGQEDATLDQARAAAAAALKQARATRSASLRRLIAAG